MSGYRRNSRNEMASDSAVYRKGYLDGQRSAFEESELDAYYAGVGYGKKAAGDKYIGFNSHKEREQFEAGMAKKDKHFIPSRVERLTFWERLFGGRSAREKVKRVKPKHFANNTAKNTGKKKAAKRKTRSKKK